MSHWSCPHCGFEYTAVGNHQDDSGQHQCDECGGEFTVTIDYSPEYSVEAIDFVSPEDKARNDAMERAEYQNDRDKDERAERRQ